MYATSLIFLSFALASGLAAQEGSFDKTLVVSGPVNLDIKTASGGITVTQGLAGSVQIHAILRAEHGWFGSDHLEERMKELERHPPVEQNGNHVRVGYVQGRDLLRGISMRLEIRTPSDSQIQARAESGGIRVDGVRGPVECKTESGGIEIRDVAADVRAAAESGGVHIRNIKGSVSARAESGGIEAMEVAGRIDVETQSGSIRLDQTTAAPINARAASGGVTVKLAPASGYDISAETASGRISVPAMLVQGAYSPHHVDGKIGNGGPLVRIRAASGSVRID
jgi:DUF4097 and DUF4098 domain-containing protein YvlB